MLGFYMVTREEKILTLAGLTLKQERFVKEFCATRKAAQSYKVAYNTENMKKSSISECATQELAKPKIQEGIVAFMTLHPSTEPDALNPEYIKRQLKHEIETSETDGARVNAIGIASKVFGMQTIKTIDETAKLDDHELALSLASSHYQDPPQDPKDLDPVDQAYYQETLIRLQG